MIVAGASGFVKNQYRKFNIKAADLTPGDDYAMMREVLTRRFKRLVLDEAEAPVSLPVIPDGVARAEDEQRSDPGSDGGSDLLHEVPDNLGASASASGMTGAPSRIEQPQPPPIDRRGGSAIAFGVLRADVPAEGGPPAETDPNAPQPVEAEEPDPATRNFPIAPTSC